MDITPATKERRLLARNSRDSFTVSVRIIAAGVIRGRTASSVGLGIEPVCPKAGWATPATIPLAGELATWKPVPLKRPRE